MNRGIEYPLNYVGETRAEAKRVLYVSSYSYDNATYEEEPVVNERTF